MISSDLLQYKFFVAGHNGMVGSSIIRKLIQSNIPSRNIITADRKELDLTNQNAVNDYFKEVNVDFIIIAAAKVGGIKANNDYPANFIYENLMIECNIIHAAHINNIDKIIFLGSSCIYPKYSKQPILESELLTGSLEQTNEAYAIAKIAGLKMCEYYSKQYGRKYFSLMPTNLYGPGDNFSIESSHVIPGIIAKMHSAKIYKESKVTLWGTGKPLREFLHVDDLADAIVFAIKNSENFTQESYINVGSGYDISILDLSKIIKNVIDYKGKIEFDSSFPDGTPRKLMNSSKVNNIGWEPSISLENGIQDTYQWYLENLS